MRKADCHECGIRTPRICPLCRLPVCSVCGRRKHYADDDVMNFDDSKRKFCPGVRAKRGRLGTRHL